MNQSAMWAKAVQEARDRQVMEDMRPRASAGPNAAFGGGIGDLSGWAVFFG